MSKDAEGYEHFIHIAAASAMAACVAVLEWSRETPGFTHEEARNQTLGVYGSLFLDGMELALRYALKRPEHVRALFDYLEEESDDKDDPNRPPRERWEAMFIEELDIIEGRKGHSL